MGTDIAGRLHTGSSRNDQVAHGFATVVAGGGARVTIIVKRPRGRAREMWPGPTWRRAPSCPATPICRRAQPVRYSHWLMSHAWAWTRDAERLDALWARSDRCPLGSGALAGHPFFDEQQRQKLSDALKFGGGPTPNSMDSVSDRDFAVEFTQWAALLGVHLSRWAEDLIIYGTKEFAFVSFGQRYSTGSSLMPQKRNPDALDVVAGQGRAVGGPPSYINIFTRVVPVKDLRRTAYAATKTSRRTRSPVFDAAHQTCAWPWRWLGRAHHHRDPPRAACRSANSRADVAALWDFDRSSRDALATARAGRGVVRERRGTTGSTTCPSARRTTWPAPPCGSLKRRTRRSRGCDTTRPSRAQLATLHPAFENDSDADASRVAKLSATLWDFDRSADRRGRAQVGSAFSPQSPEGAGRGGGC